jgi:hypothetical protein
MGDKPGFYRSTDLGATWETPRGTGMGMVGVSAIAADTDTIIAGSTGSDSTAAALWCSTDNGTSWSRIGTVYSDAAARAGDTLAVVTSIHHAGGMWTATTSQGMVLTAQAEKGVWKVARSKAAQRAVVSMMDMATLDVRRADTTLHFASVRDADGFIAVELTTSSTPVARRTRVSSTQQGAYVVCSLLKECNGLCVAGLRDLTDLRGPDRIYVSRFDGGMQWDALPPITAIPYGAKAIDAITIGPSLYVVFDAMGGVWKITLR